MKMYIFCMLVICQASLHCLPLKQIAQSAFWVNVTVLLGQPAAAHVSYHGCNICGPAVHLICLLVCMYRHIWCNMHTPLIACLQLP